MKLSYDWLGDFVDLSGLTPEEVAEKLTMGAFEVEEIKRVGPDIKGDIVVGEIVEIIPHPDPTATKIRMTKTRVQPGAAPIEIICGAWNIEPGQRIPVAMPGSTVINRKDGTPLPIKVGQIKGATSNGMLCSPPELGISGSGEGILILDPSTPVGTNAKELLNLTQDAILYVEPRSNRGDALCVLGLAREVAALTGRPLKSPDWKLPAVQAGLPVVSVNIENLEDCPFFTIRTLTGIKIGPAPSWMVRRLEAVGMRSVNNVVDITNYVMQELGQPLHAYDLRHVNGNHLEVRRARQGEKLITIDERERELSPEVMMIADKNGVVGVAGVMGGKGSEIADDTSNVALEAAAFNMQRVRRSSRTLGLSSDSSLRFERGVDVAGVRRASDRAAHLMVEHCGATLGEMSTAGSDQIKPLYVELRLSQVERLTELKVSDSEADKLLSPLGFKVEKSGDKIKVEVPSFRMRDVTREVDLVEEVTRLYGYDKVPVSMPKRTVAPPLPETTLNTVKDALSACGLNEAWISSLVALDDINGRGSFEADDSSAVKVLNPLSDEHQVLRQSLIPGLLKALAYNQDRGIPDVWLFETGLTYARHPDGQRDRSLTATSEMPLVGAAITGQRSLSALNPAAANNGAHSSEHLEFYLLKGVLENLFERLSIPERNIAFSTEEAAPSWYHPSCSARVVYRRSPRDKEAKPLGWIGIVHPRVARNYGLKKPACVFELEVEALRAARGARQFKEFFSTPVVYRDLTADVPIVTEQASVRQVITQTGGQMLRNVELVSIFDLSQDLKSLSYRLSFQHPEQTPTAEEIDKSLSKVRDQLARQLSATFRT